MRGSPAEAMAQSIDQIHPPGQPPAASDTSPVVRPTPERGWSRMSSAASWSTTAKTDRRCGPMCRSSHIDDAGALIEILGVTRDISDRKRHEDELQAARDAAAPPTRRCRELPELERLALTDDLKPVWERRQAFQRARRRSAGASDQGNPLSLLLIDLDRFKSVNDTMGHVRGDGVLIDTARILVRPSASRPRGSLGGEFLVLAPATSAEGCRVAGGTRPASGRDRVTRPEMHSPVSASHRGRPATPWRTSSSGLTPPSAPYSGRNTVRSA